MAYRPHHPPTEEFTRVRVPHESDGEMLGIVEGLMGASRLLIKCADGKERMIRIPGKIRRNIWVKTGDIVILKPWSIEADKKGDLVWRYTKLQAEWLRRKGILKD